MRDFTQEQLEEGRPNQEPQEAVEFCLKQLFRDLGHEITDRVSPRLTYEELIGALLLARDALQDYEEYSEEVEL